MSLCRMNPTLSRSIDMDIPEGGDEEGSGREKITNPRRRKAFRVQCSMLPAFTYGEGDPCSPERPDVQFPANNLS